MPKVQVGEKTVPDEIITKVARFIGTDPTTVRKKSYL
jgi:hypothetical protein